MRFFPPFLGSGPVVSLLYISYLLPNNNLSLNLPCTPNTASKNLAVLLLSFTWLVLLCSVCYDVHQSCGRNSLSCFVGESVFKLYNLGAGAPYFNSNWNYMLIALLNIYNYQCDSVRPDLQSSILGLRQVCELTHHFTALWTKAINVFLRYVSNLDWGFM